MRLVTVALDTVDCGETVGFELCCHSFLSFSHHWHLLTERVLLLFIRRVLREEIQNINKDGIQLVTLLAVIGIMYLLVIFSCKSKEREILSLM